MKRLAPLVLSLVALAGCGKNESAPTQAAAPTTTTITVNGAQVAVREEEGLLRYSDEGPESGTVMTSTDANVRKGADMASPSIGRIGRGTGVNKKARRGPFYLVDYPSAGGAMKPGWILQSDVSGQVPAVVTTIVPPTTTTVPVVAPPPGARPPKITSK